MFIEVIDIAGDPILIAKDDIGYLYPEALAYGDSHGKRDTYISFKSGGYCYALTPYEEIKKWLT